jgi:phenylacetate-coenzyme A ligase PaaK-like adenylate-forming protein
MLNMKLCSREDLEALQLKRLQAVVDRVYHLVLFYR